MSLSSEYSPYRKRVSYFYDSQIACHYYGKGHPMKPQRIRMTNNLVLNYGLYRKLDVFRPRRPTADDIARFHDREYVEFLQRVRPGSVVKPEANKQSLKFNVGEDCPIFDGIFDYCQISAGGSLDAARMLNHNRTDIAINWSGGMHHAKKCEASGFCYVNDVVLAILELLRFHQRVLYVDIDVHHGDGVEEAFYATNRVMTVSFHKYGEFFPGTGDIKDCGVEEGKHYAINFPLRDGIDDDTYETVFKPVITKVMEMYRPEVIVLQCGSDSLTGDRLGCFNLTLYGHGRCLTFMKSFDVPLLIVGGGGYTIKNVARCWTYETSLALGSSIKNELPYNDYFEYFAPDFKLHIPQSNMTNHNSSEYLQGAKAAVFEILRMIPHAPSVHMQDIPYVTTEDEDQFDVEASGQEGQRISQQERDRRILADEELSDSDTEFLDVERSERRRNIEESRVARAADAAADLRANCAIAPQAVQTSSSDHGCMDLDEFVTDETAMTSSQLGEDTTENDGDTEEVEMDES